jgi:hypothetical protein
MTPRLPDIASGFKTQGYSAITAAAAPAISCAGRTSKRGLGSPAFIRAVRDRRLSVHTRAAAGECHGSSSAAAARAASSTGRSPTAITPLTGYRPARSTIASTDPPRS